MTQIKELACSGEFPSTKTIHELIAQVAEHLGDKTAVSSLTSELTYSQLISQSRLLAAHLQNAGVDHGDLVGICVERNPSALVALLAILQLGAGYVPLDPDYPIERLSHMVADSELRTIIGSDSYQHVTAKLDAPVVSLENALHSSRNLDGIEPIQSFDSATTTAYVIYTSGSTGKPKGVRVQHQAVVNFLYGMQDTPGASDNDVILAMTTFSFDISVLELFLPLVTGGTVAIVSREDAKDGKKLISAIEKLQVTVMQATPSTWRFVVEAGWQGGPEGFKILTGGEPLPTDLVHPLFDRCTELWNVYGPTETTVWSTACKITDPKAKVLIGSPILNTNIRIVDEQGEFLGASQEGELLIGGSGVTLGYLNRPELTSEKFIEIDGQRFYRTGDLARFTDCEQIECLGRIDSQIKLHGHRIELGEIDAAFAEHPSIRRAAATVREDRPGDKRLVVYLVPEGNSFDRTELLQFVAVKLPEYMLPGLLVSIDTLPLTPSGKLDRKALPIPSSERPEISVAFRAPNTPLEEQLAAIWSDVLAVDLVGIDDNFFELGGNSILALQTIARMEAEAGRSISAAEFFDRPSISLQLNGNTSGKQRRAVRNSRKDFLSDDQFAIVGMSAKFPGASNLQEFWNNLREGRESISFFSPEELDATISTQQTDDKNYVPARGVIEDAECFDAKFFGVSPKEAELLDPQQRILLELAYAALEDAGCVPEDFEGRIGVWAGAYQNNYLTKNLLSNQELVDEVGEFQLGVYNEKDYIATRIAHRLNLTGPAINVNTACSTSLVAVIEACDSLRLGRCDMALAGGVSVILPKKSGHLYQQDSILSPDGHCRPFDSQAAGTLFCDGAGLVAIKRLNDAKRDGDHIWAVIRGSGINNDGGEKASFSAPSIDGQAAAISDALQEAAIRADEIGYVEAHGTATPIGDPIEVSALTQAFGLPAESETSCYLGSVKSNIGHTVAAAGVAGLIKSALSLHNEQIPPTLHYQSANEQIAFEKTPFKVCDRLTEWSRTEKPRYAGISSFGVGGTNAHVILEEAPLAATNPQERHSDSFLLPVSAKSPEALAEQIELLGNFLADQNPDISKVARTLQTGRNQLRYRQCFDANSIEDAVSALTSNNQPRPRTASKNRDIAFVFPGQGSQYLGMCEELFESSTMVRGTLEQCDELLSREFNIGLLQILFGEKTAESEAALKDTAVAQPALLSVGIALGSYWKSLGIKPAAVLGHSVGEYAAAYFAGVMTLETALRLIANRARLMSAQPAGSMLSVRLSGKEIEPKLSGNLVVASYNAPNLCVVAGPTDQIEIFAGELNKQDIVTKTLHTSHAFHSPMMQPVVSEFRAIVAAETLCEPCLPMYSTATGELITDELATSPEYWASQIRQPVRFAAAVEALWQDAPSRALLELGPRSTLCSLARQIAKGEQDRIAIPALGDVALDFGERKATLRAIGELWKAGADLNWELISNNGSIEKTSLPTYPFARTRYFIEAPIRTRSDAGSETSSSSQPTDVQDSALSTKAASTESRTNAAADSVNESESSLVFERVCAVFETSSGFDLSELETDVSFFEMGMDSLVLTQTASALKREFGIAISFRQLLEQIPTPQLLVEFLEEQLPEDQTANLAAASTKSSELSTQAGAQSSQIQAPEGKKTFGAGTRVSLNDEALPESQQRALDVFIERYTEKSLASKEFAQSHRKYLADPRTVSGFRPALKEITYPIVAERSKGGYIWDLNGNKYIDVTSGFGSNFLGHSPDFMVEAVAEQLQLGYEIGPQTPGVGEAAKLFCELTNLDRVAFCNTGSEAVLGALRLARNYTGCDKFVMFTGDYHGISDEVIARTNGQGKTFPAASGIPATNVQNTIILEYGSDEALKYIEQNLNDLAAVLIEPVQSRRPEFQPKEFMQKVSDITSNADTALIFDEVITGFRIGSGGAQEHFGVQADLATYGKVVGGGMPIGAIGGKAKYMDGLDGGFWQFGDESKPEVGVTYFAGTFVRHPLAVAASRSILRFIKEQGQGIYDDLNSRTDRMAKAINSVFAKYELPIFFANFGSLFRVQFKEDTPWSELLFAALRYRGIHIWDNRPCLLTLAHTDEDVSEIVAAFEIAVEELVEAGFLTPAKASATEFDHTKNNLPAQSSTPDSTISSKDDLEIPSNARLGKDRNGEPAWFIPDAGNPGRFVQLDIPVS